MLFLVTMIKKNNIIRKTILSAVSLSFYFMRILCLLLSYCIISDSISLISKFSVIFCLLYPRHSTISKFFYWNYCYLLKNPMEEPSVENCKNWPNFWVIEANLSKLIGLNVLKVCTKNILYLLASICFLFDGN